jgi:hypothetical protein
MHLTAGATLSHTAPTTRDDRWLAHVLDRIWDDHFGDTPRCNEVLVNFRGVWKSRLGSISMSYDQSTTFIQINALLRLTEVPEHVAQITVAHELVHYAHGFGSPLPRRYKHPHRGGIVKRELLRRGMADVYADYDAWVYDKWYDFYASWTAAGGRSADTLEPGLVASRLPPE